MSQYDHLKKDGYSIVFDVNGFNDAKSQMYALIRERIIKCDSCDNSATHIFWQDRAEWYLRCDDHRGYEEMWTGSTRWNPVDVSLPIILNNAKQWYKSLPEDEKSRYKLVKFDATPYYDMLPEDFWDNHDTRTIEGGDDTSKYLRHVYATIDRLTCGGYIWRLTRRTGFSSYTGVMHGIYDTADEAFGAAVASIEVERK